MGLLDDHVHTKNRLHGMSLFLICSVLYSTLYLLNWYRVALHNCMHSSIKCWCFNIQSCFFSYFIIMLYTLQKMKHQIGILTSKQRRINWSQRITIPSRLADTDVSCSEVSVNSPRYFEIDQDVAAVLYPWFLVVLSLSLLLRKRFLRSAVQEQQPLLQF